MGSCDLSNKVTSLREFIVFDTETTGMPPGARLVEIGAIKVRGKTIVERFDELVFPECPIPQEVIDVHGITNKAVSGARVASEVLPDFFAWAKGLPLVAHNAPFDAAMLASECARLSIPCPDNPTLCTLQASRKLLPGQSHSLESLVSDLGLPAATHHRAGEDASHALNLLWHLQAFKGNKFKNTYMGSGKPISAYAPEAPSLKGGKTILQECAHKAESVDIQYVFANRGRASLRVSPRFFYQRRSTIFMEALRHQAFHYKTYRIDRIANARPCPEAPPPTVRR